jgi:quinol monooxygenase YgiN
MLHGVACSTAWSSTTLRCSHDKLYRGSTKAEEFSVIFIVVKFTIHPDKADEWPSLIEEFTEATRGEEGNIFFEWSRSVDAPNQFVLVEAFADSTAGEVHVNSDHFKNFIAWVPEVIVKKPEIVNVEVPGDGWGQMAELTPASAS